MRALPTIALATILALTFACEEKTKSPSEVKPTESPQAKSETDPAGARAATPVEPVKAELLDEATERRLHPNRAAASSFLWIDFNRFQENYHPLYLIDDDPTTAWVEGATGDGSGEWIKLDLTAVAEATKVKLRLRNGYQKSKSLFGKNARAKNVTITLLPSNTTVKHELTDEMGWQNIIATQPSGPLEAIEIKVDSVYPGSKYADLCLSDAEVFVTSRTPENPEFEKKKLAEVKKWKEERIAAAKLFKSKSKDIPVVAGYRVTGNKLLKGAKAPDGKQLPNAIAMLDLAITGGVGDPAQLKSASESFKSGFSDWMPVEASVKGARKLPAIDGLYTPRGMEFIDHGTTQEDAFAAPAPGKLEYLTANRVSTFESSSKATVSDVLAGKLRACKRQDREHYSYFRPKPEGSAQVPALRQLLVVICGRFEERDGFYDYAGPQLLTYGENGQLEMIVSASSVTTLDWSTSAEGSKSAKLTGGKRVRRSWGPKVYTDTLVVARAK